MDWEDLKTVLAVHRTNTLSGAARSLNVSHSTVLRRLQAMEERLGVKVFERRREGLVATMAGEEMAEIGERFEEDVQGLERRLVGRDLRPSGCVRVTTAEVLATHMLAPIIADFVVAYPEIEIELVTTASNLNLTKRDADVAVRPTARPLDTLIGRRIGPLMTAVYAIPSYIARHGRDLTAPDHIWCGFDETMAHTDIFKAQQRLLGDKPAHLRANTVQGIVTFVASGAGLAVMPCFVGDQMEGFVRLGDPFDNSGVELWLLTHKDLRGAARVQAFMEFFGRALKQRRYLLEGLPAPENA